MQRVYLQFAGIVNAAPNASFRIRGQKLAREPHRYSGRTSHVGKCFGIT